MPAKPLFEELDYQKTPMGELILRRRTVLQLEGRDVHEVILGDAFLMSSLFTVVEEELARLGVAAAVENFPPGTMLDVVVGGLGLGHTAWAALETGRVGHLWVVDVMAPVIGWHEKGLVPLGAGLTADPRCRFVHGDFFELATAERGEPGFDPETNDRRFHAVLLDIDHSPSNLLHERHGSFYRADGLRMLAEKLHPGGVFALWSDDPPEEGFLAALGEVFSTTESHCVSFENPLLGGSSQSTVYIARTAAG